MLKKIIQLFCIFSLCLMFGCSNTKDYSQYAGTYTADDSSTVTVEKDGKVNISIFRLCDMDGEITDVKDQVLSMIVEDPAESDMILEFNTESHILTVVDSTWEYLNNGDTFTFNQ